MTTTVPEGRDPRTYAALFAMCLIWGSTFLVIRIGNESVSPLWAASIRLLLAVPLYLSVALITGAPFGGRVAVRTALAYGSLNYGVNFALLYWGEQRVPSGTAAVIYATIPLTTAIFARVLRVHSLDVRQLVASFVGLAGVAIVFSGELLRGAPIGALAAVMTGATCASLAAVLLKKGTSASTWTTNAMGASAGAVICLLGSVALGESHELPRSRQEWWPILYLVFAGNLGAYALYAWLVTKWNVVRLNVITLAIPVIAVVLGSIVRHEAPGAATYAGGLLVLAGVTISLLKVHPALDGEAAGRGGSQ
jgi:drug/metabolite transporter (DMT)-like permease